MSQPSKNSQPSNDPGQDEQAKVEAEPGIDSAVKNDETVNNGATKSEPKNEGAVINETENDGAAKNESENDDAAKNQPENLDEPKRDSKNALSAKSSDSEDSKDATENVVVKSKNPKEKEQVPAGQQIVNPQKNSDFNQVLAERYAARRLELIRSEAKSLLVFIWPLIICMTVSATIALIIKPTVQDSLIHQASSAYGQENAAAGTALTITFIIVSVVVLTSILVFLVYKEWWIPVYVWLGVSLFLIGTYINMFIIFRICESLNIPADWITVSIFCFNFGALLVVAINWRSVTWVGNALKIAMSVISAITFVTILPNYGVYILLVLMSIWDLIAVLPEKGPLKLLIKYVSNSKKGQKAFGGLAYAGCFFLGIDHDVNENHHQAKQDQTTNHLTENPNLAENAQKLSKPEIKIRENRNNNRENGPTAVESAVYDQNKGAETSGAVAPAAFINVPSESSQEDLSPPSISISQDSREVHSGGQLGLGDFVFYSVLTANLAAHTPLLGTMIISMHLILLGLMATSIIVYIWERPLPALPISLTITVIYAVLTDFFMTPVIGTISLNNYY